MAKSYGGINYPDTIDKIMKDFGMFRVLKGMVGKEETKNMLAYLEKRPKASMIYTEWVGPQASKKVPLSTKVKKAATDLGKSAKSSDPKAWEKIGDLLEKDFINEFNSRILPAFFKSKQFYDFHCKNALTVIGTKYGMPKDVAKRLGLKSVKKVEFLLMSILADSASEAKSDAKKIIKEEKLTCSEAELIAAVKTKSAGKLKKKMF